MACKLWGKVTSVSVNINSGAKMSILCKKNWNFGRNVDFFIKCALLLEVIIFLQNVLIFKTMCQNLIKKIQFVYVLIFIKVFHLLDFFFFQNIILFSDKIMSCKLWGKITSVSVNINFGAKMLILCKKKKNFERNVDFFIKYALPLKVIIFLQNMPIFRKMWFFVCRFIYINKVSNSDKKNVNFFGYVNLYMC